MTFLEAMKLLDSGKMVKRTAWSDLGTVYENVQGQVGIVGVGSYATASLNSADIKATDWIEYVEPTHDFKWALEQIRAGKQVQQKSRFVIRGFASKVNHVEAAIASLPFSVKEIEATDWVLAK